MIGFLLTLAVGSVASEIWTRVVAGKEHLQQQPHLSRDLFMDFVRNRIPAEEEEEDNNDEEFKCRRNQLELIIVNEEERQKDAESSKPLTTAES